MAQKAQIGIRDQPVAARVPRGRLVFRAGGNDGMGVAAGFWPAAWVCYSVFTVGNLAGAGCCAGVVACAFVCDYPTVTPAGA